MVHLAPALICWWLCIAGLRHLLKRYSGSKSFDRGSAE
jgi:hypothetical protein